MLSNAQAVQDVLKQDKGVLEAIENGKVVIDMSTIAPEESMSFSQLVAEKGGIYLDAPVSGSVGAAQGAQLVILVGGDQNTLGKSQPYFNILGKKPFILVLVEKGVLLSYRLICY